MNNIEIKIIGAGLVVNSTAELVNKVLRDAGYNVTMPDYAGQRKGDIAAKHPERINIHIDVEPLPWGG